MISRPLTIEDLAAVLAVRNAVEADDGLPVRTPPDELEDEMTDDAIDLAVDSTGTFADDGSCIAYGWVRLAPDPSPVARWASVHVAVHPDHTGQGIGRRLLAQLSARAEALLADVEPDPPPMLTAHVTATQAAAIHLLEDAGYSPIRYLDELTIDLAAVTPPRTDRGLPADVSLLPWDPARSSEAKGVHRGAFADHWGSSPITERDWQRLTAPPRFDGDLSTIAVRRAPDGDPEHDAIVGMVIVSLWPEDWPAVGREEAWIDVVAAARDARGRGLAAGMLRRTIDVSRDRGLTHATLAVDTDNPTGAHRLYAGMGFATTSRMQRWARPPERQP